MRIKDNRAEMPNDFFTKRYGFVIDGTRIGSRTATMRHLTTTCCMEEEEATHFMDRLYAMYVKEYNANLSISRKEVR